MKYRIALALALFSLTAVSQAATLCEQKENEIQQEISHAKKYNNQNRLHGLNQALSEVRAHCNDSELRAKHQEKIARQQAEISERTGELAEAKQKGDADKIAKRERKLAEAKQELKELQAREY